MGSDLNKHPETEGHKGIGIGLMLLANGSLNDKAAMRKFINGFH